MGRNHLRRVVGYIHPSGTVYIEDAPEVDEEPEFRDKEPPAGFEDRLYEEAKDLEFERKLNGQARTGEAAP